MTIVKRAVKSVAVHAFTTLSRTFVGRWYEDAVFRTEDGLERCTVALRSRALGMTFDRLPSLRRFPVQGFHDVQWLFTASEANHGIAQLSLDEAAYLWKIASEARSSQCLEIGRFKGGSTFLMAAALDDNSRLVSVDNHSYYPGLFDPPKVDASLRAALTACGLDRKVQLLITDSRSLELRRDSLDLVFVDGDHSYEGARADYRAVRSAIRTGGSLLFHDAMDASNYRHASAGIKELVREIDKLDAPYFRREGGAGMIVHFKRSSEPFPS